MLLGLRDNLELEGYEVQTAADGEQGLAKAAAFAPDLVILDLMLPRKNGFDVCRELRARVEHDARRDADRALAGDRQGARPRARRRRLRHQAVQHHRAAGPRPRRAAPHRVAQPPHRAVPHRRHRDRLPQHQARRGGAASSSRPREFDLLRYFVQHTGRGRHPRTDPERGLGLRGVPRPRARSTISSRSCGRRSSGPRTSPSTSSPSTAAATSSSADRSGSPGTPGRGALALRPGQRLACAFAGRGTRARNPLGYTQGQWTPKPCSSRRWSPCVVFLIRWFVVARARLAAGGHGSHEPVQPTPLHLFIGPVTNFFDTLGIGSFAPTTSMFRAGSWCPTS